MSDKTYICPHCQTRLQPRADLDLPGLIYGNGHQCPECLWIDWRLVQQLPPEAIIHHVFRCLRTNPDRVQRMLARVNRWRLPKQAKSIDAPLAEVEKLIQRHSLWSSPSDEQAVISTKIAEDEGYRLYEHTDHDGYGQYIASVELVEQGPTRTSIRMVLCQSAMQALLRRFWRIIEAERQAERETEKKKEAKKKNKDADDVPTIAT